MIKKHWLSIIAILLVIGTQAQLKHSEGSAFTSYKGLVMAGYQGWFNAPDDGAGRGWNHYANRGKFEPGICKIDLWPDVSEYSKVYKTPFAHEDGSPAWLFSSYDASTVDLHFKWMQQYGLDGVFVQRFVSNVKSPVSLHHNNTVLGNALDAAQKYHRAIAVMYDFSGMKAGDYETVINDWKLLVDSLRLTTRDDKQSYLYHNGKPLVALWGVGFPGRPYGLKDVEKIMDFLKNDKEYGGCSIMLGVPGYWRDLDKDTDKDPYLLELIQKADIVHPWFVGRYREESYPAFEDHIRGDIDWCTKHKLDYAPVVFPGFSWHNMYDQSPMNQIPRNKGKFYWKQIAGALQSGAQMLYVSMFDEVDEGTAIFKSSKNPPVGLSNFVSFEKEIPEDYYLYLTGLAAKMLRKQIPLQVEIPSPVTAQSHTSYVDPYIGSGDHGHVFVGVSVPFGAVQLGPDNIYKGWDWCSGYNYGDSLIIGFAHTHLSGTGIGDLADVLIMPYTGDVKTSKGTESDHRSGYGSLYSHKNEVVKPAYYSVKLDDYNIRVELTASERVGFHQYHFPDGKKAHVIIDLKEGINDHSTDTYIRQVDKYTLEGYRFSSGWAKDQWLFFAIRLSEPIQQFNVYDDNNLLQGETGKGKAIKGLISFSKAPATLKMKVGISPVSAENALANITAEIPHWNFNEIVKEADRKWNKELSKIDISTTSEKDKHIFYTALYHTMIDPAIFNDHNGDYRGTDKKVYKKASFTNYSVFSLWDTYRAANPLYIITQPERVGDMVNSMLAIYDQQGRLPKWHLEGNETGTMVGISSLQVVAEACLKGATGFDTNRAFEAMKSTAMSDTMGLSYVKNFAAIPTDKESRAVAKGLEYAISDGSIALLAQRMNKTGDYNYFKKRAGNYRAYFDTDNKFFRGKLANGEWTPGFNPLATNNNTYAEGNAWQYLWLVPQDVKGLIALLGGEKIFNERLDSLFSLQAPGDMKKLADITGTIGQYAHGNEPSHHIAYLYVYGGRQWKTAEKVRYIMKEMYHEKPDGIIGNEDCGQMSAWYIFSSLGFYPVFPASEKYVIGSPLFDQVAIHLPKGKTFTIKVINNSSSNIYVQGIKLNGKKYNHGYINHSDIIGGGVMEISMGGTPNVAFARREEDLPW